MNRILLSFCLSLGLALSIHAAETTSPHMITARDLINFPSIRSLDMNAKTNIIIYGLRETRAAENAYREHIWIMHLDGSGQRQLTYSSGSEWQGRLSPDGLHLAFLSNRPDDKGEKHTRLWVMPLDGGEARAVTPSDQSIIDFKWQGDSQHLFFLSSAPRPAAVNAWQDQQKKQGFDAVDRNPEHPNMEIWSVDIARDKQRRRFVGDPGVTGFDVNAQGTLLVYSTNYTGDDNDWVETDLFLFSLEDSVAVRQLTKARGSEDEPRFSPDGRLIAYTRPQDARKPFSQKEIEIIPVTGGKIQRVTRNLDHTIGKFAWYTDHSLLLEVSKGLTNHICQASLTGEISALSGGDVYLFRSAVQAGHPEIAALRETATGLGEIVLSRGPGHPWEVLTDQSAALANYITHPQTAFYWTSRDGRYKLEGLVVLPRFSSDRPLPLVVDIHGGPAARTDLALQQGGLYQAWASQGFAVFAPNYRGSEGYGEAFLVANYQDLGGGDYHDIMTGVKALIARGIADPDSLVVMGGSYGGYMTNWIITQTHMFKAAVSKYGIFDLKGDFSNSNYAQWELDYLGKTYWEAPALYRRMSPASFIKQAKTPTLILHGADDENTFTSNSRELARALKTLNTPHHFFLYPREGHGMYEPSHRLDVFQRELNWVNRHLKRQQANRGTDWLAGGIRVQITAVDPQVRFLNRDNREFLQLSLLLDGSRLTENQHLLGSDFQLIPGFQTPVGLPSGQILAPMEYFDLELGPDRKSVELELVFPADSATDQILRINGVGDFALPH